MNKRFALVAVGAALALGLSACGGGGAGSPAAGETSGGTAAPADVTVGVAMPTQTSQRWIDDGNNVKAGLEKLGYKVDLQYANDDIPTQASQLTTMINNGDKVLIIASIDGTALSSQLADAAAAGIKVISYDRLIRGSANVDFYVSFDNFKVGVQQGTSLLTGLGVLNADGSENASAAGPFNVELFAGSLDDNNAKFFYDGAMSVLKPYIDKGTIKIPSGQTDINQIATQQWKTDVAQRRMETLLTSSDANITLNGVLAPADIISRGVITALTNAGYGSGGKAFPIVTGQDADIDNVKLINDGKQYSTIFKDTRKLADEAIKVTGDYLSGKEPEANNTKDYDNGNKVVPSYLLESTVVTKDNVKSVLVDSGYYTQAQVDKGQK
ncbi:multiple monosaccharide ABC transporter substrate-binding protein [Quadrisphaera granulorum]|uniref:multiple monosaccharide ABC transporter substrate-binding protein n=1 Tax=Quadrisphaera granulorum TaxID=317664 RepID=UPI000D6B36D7|nr:multiple monosaccharide ABC transporter substrate-binding protein [Quadrisphaera granulorum]